MEGIYTRLEQAGRTPTPVAVLLPFLYKRAATAMPEEPAILIGEYLRRRYPEVGEYYTTRTQRESVEQLHATLDSFFDET